MMLMVDILDSVSRREVMTSRAALYKTAQNIHHSHYQGGSI